MTDTVSLPQEVVIYAFGILEELYVGSVLRGGAWAQGPSHNSASKQAGGTGLC